MACLAAGRAAGNERSGEPAKVICRMQGSFFGQRIWVDWAKSGSVGRWSGTEWAFQRVSQWLRGLENGLRRGFWPSKKGVNSASSRHSLTDTTNGPSDLLGGQKTLGIIYRGDEDEICETTGQSHEEVVYPNRSAAVKARHLVAKVEG